MKFGVFRIPAVESREMVFLAKVAEETGYDSFWVADELPPAGLFRDEFLVLAHAALSTNRITVGPSAYGYARHPAWIAKAVATLDEISGGRAAMILKVGRELGRQEKITGVDFPLELSMPAAYKEVIQICKGLWSGKPFTYNGKLYKMKDTQVKVKCRPDIPIFVEGYGDEMQKMSGLYADGIMAGMVPAEYVPSMKKPLEEGFKLSGRKGPYTLSLNLFTTIAKTREEARKALDYLIVLPIRLFPHRPEVLESVGLTREDLAPALKAGIKPGANYAKMLKPEVADLMIEKFTLCGTADDIINRLREYEKIGVNSFEVGVAVYPFSITKTVEQIRMIGESVIPSFKP